MYYYSLYNLIIASQVRIKTLEAVRIHKAISGFDVSITLGKTPDRLPGEPVSDKLCARMKENEFLFYHRVLGVRFYVKNRGEIIIDQAYYADPDRVFLFLLGSVMGAVLYMWNMIPMHAATVETQTGAVLLVGRSGVGKSTLAFGLMQRGYAVLGDDMAPVKAIEGRVAVYPGPPQLKLWQDALAMNGKDRHGYARVRAQLEKYYVDVDHHSQTYSPVPVRRICHLSAHNGTKILSATIASEKERLNTLRTHTYRRHYVRGLKREAAHFLATTGLARLPMVRFRLPRNHNNFPDLLDLLEEAVLK